MRSATDRNYVICIRRGRVEYTNVAKRIVAYEVAATDFSRLPFNGEVRANEALEMRGIGYYIAIVCNGVSKRHRTVELALGRCYEPCVCA